MRSCWKCIRVLGVALVVWCLSAATEARGGNTFATERLQKMAKLLSEVPFDSLSVGYHTDYSFQGHPLTIRVNQWNEVDHIGYKIFDTTTYRSHSALVYDFLERYLLDLSIDNEIDKHIRMGIDKFVIEEGTLETVFQLEEGDEHEVSYNEFKRYRVAWKRDGKCILSFMFDMDYQLMSGCNAIELEKNYIRAISRLQGQKRRKEHTLPREIEAHKGKYYIQEGESFLIPAIRNNRYFVFDSFLVTDTMVVTDGIRGNDTMYYRDTVCFWDNVCASSKAVWSAFNLMLSSTSMGRFFLDATLDMYGYQSQQLTKIPMADWVAYTKSEGCEIFLGLKSKTHKYIRGTLFCPNVSAGYCHMMSVEIPISSFNNKGGVVTGRLYTYIPLHNITDDYFELKYLTTDNFSTE